MEDSINRSPNIQPSDHLIFTEEIIAFIRKTAKWGKFLSLLGFISIALLILAGVGMSIILNFVGDTIFTGTPVFSSKLLSVVYLVIACIYLVPVIYLNSFSNQVLKAISLRDQKLLTSSFKNLKNLTAFIGISIIVLLALYFTGILIGGAAIFWSI